MVRYRALSPLTPAQLRVLQVLRLRSLRGDLPPTYRELQGELGFRSTATVRDHLKALERKGYVRLAGRRFRGVQVLSRGYLDLSDHQCEAGRFSDDRSQAGAKWFAQLLPDGGIAVLWSVSASCESQLGLRPSDRLMIDQGAAPASGDWLAYSSDGESLARVSRDGIALPNRASSRGGSSAELRLVGVVRAVIRQAAAQRKDVDPVFDDRMYRPDRGVNYAAR